MQVTITVVGIDMLFRVQVSRGDRIAGRCYVWLSTRLQQWQAAACLRSATIEPGTRPAASLPAVAPADVTQAGAGAGDAGPARSDSLLRWALWRGTRGSSFFYSRPDLFPRLTAVLVSTALQARPCSLLHLARPCLLPGPRDVRMHVAASVQDVVIQDLRARKEHRWGEARQLPAAVRAVVEQALSWLGRRLHPRLPPGQLHTLWTPDPSHALLASHLPCFLTAWC